MSGWLQKTNSKLCRALLALSFIFCFMSLETTAGDIKIVNLDPGAALHMRAAPDKSSKVLAYIPGASTDFQVTGVCDVKWCPVTFRGIPGWVFRRFLSFDGVAPALASEDSEGSEGAGATTAFPGFAPNEIRALQPETPAPDALSGRFYSIEGASAEQPLTIREEADDASPIRGVIPFNARQVEGLKRCVAKWCLVRYNGVVGWTPRRHLADETSAGRRLQVVNMDIASVLPVKEYPGSEAADIGFIPSYASGIVQIGACDKTWCHVRYLGFVGWVSSRFVVQEIAPKS